VGSSVELWVALCGKTDGVDCCVQDGRIRVVNSSCLVATLPKCPVIILSDPSANLPTFQLYFLTSFCLFVQNLQNIRKIDDEIVQK